MTYRIAVALAVTAFIIGVFATSARGGEEDSLGAAVLSGLVLAVIVGALAMVWIWAVS